MPAYQSQNPDDPTAGAGGTQQSPDSLPYWDGRTDGRKFVLLPEAEQVAWQLLGAIGAVVGFISICPLFVVVDVIGSLTTGPPWAILGGAICLSLAWITAVGLYTFGQYSRRRSRPFRVGFGIGLLVSCTTTGIALTIAMVTGR